jgi:hypothetical protein
MRTRISLIAVAITLALVAVTVPLARASEANDNRLVIGIQLTFDSSKHARGSFAACCVVNHHGGAEATIQSLNETTGLFEATNTYTGANGTFTIQLKGVTGPLSSPRHIARAHWTVTSGTGAYATLHGKGRLTAVTDGTNGSLTGVADGEAHPE